MMRAIKHRGPDDEGRYIEGNIGLGFVRLSILDLSKEGHQPFYDDEGRYLIIYNGEVYNYIELRKELKLLGYHFRSNTDTEVVLKAYLEWGEDSLNRFNGMWAFVIYDLLSKEIFISRDRYGIKPFYYYRDANTFIFSSEIPGILPALNQKPEANYQSIFDYLVFNRTDHTEETFFKGIRKLQHGYNIRLEPDQASSFHTYRWYDLKAHVDRSAGFFSSEEYRDTFSSAVGLRLRSDVPVGVCLSGGLDSSSIVSVLLQDYQKNDLKSFSSVYGEGQKGDESIFIHEYRELMNNMFFTYPGANTLFDDLPSFIQAHGEPTPSTGPYAHYKVMELAKDHVVVTLDGQGADEQLGGYHYFYGYYFKDLLKQVALIKLTSEIVHYLAKNKSIYGLKTFLYYLLPENLKTNLRVGENGYLDKEFARHYSSTNTIAGKLYGAESLTEALLYHFEYKLEHLLKWEDRNSMFFSLESRVPYLDYRLVEKTLSMKPGQIIKKGWTKHILREAMNHIVPEKIRKRKDKMGFVTPQDEWFRSETFKPLIDDVLNSSSFRQRNIILPERAKEIYSNHLQGKNNNSKEIWKWINLELWFRKYID